MKASLWNTVRGPASHPPTSRQCGWPFLRGQERPGGSRTTRGYPLSVIPDRLRVSQCVRWNTPARRGPDATSEECAAPLGNQPSDTQQCETEGPTPPWPREGKGSQGSAHNETKAARPAGPGPFPPVGPGRHGGTSTPARRVTSTNPPNRYAAPRHYPSGDADMSSRESTAPWVPGK